MTPLPHRLFTLSVLLLHLIFFSWGQSSNKDVKRPSCDRCDLHFSCHCSHGGFSSVPVVTEKALTLDISFNDITMVADDDLMGHTRLMALDLHGNTLRSKG